MKYERFALWAIVAVLVIVVFFQQRRSGFTLQAGTETSSISILDMMEYKSIPETKRTAYKNMLMSNATALTNTTDGGMYRMKVDQMMMAALNMPIENVPLPVTGVCANTYIMGACSMYRACPAGLTSMTVNGNVYCVCSASTTGVRFTMNPAMSPGGAPVCSTSTACPQSTITEVATGQRMCVSSCPPLGMPGTTCSTTTGPQSCTGVIIVGDCVSSNTCPSGLTTRTIGNLKYCVCPQGQKIVPPTGQGQSLTCVASCPTTMPRMITESATGQQMCVPSCPTTTPPPGYTCV